jgi:hypothetical protein
VAPLWALSAACSAYSTVADASAATPLLIITGGSSGAAFLTFMHIFLSHSLTLQRIQRIQYRFVVRSVGIIVWNGLLISCSILSFFALLLLARPSILPLIPYPALPQMVALVAVELQELGIGSDSSLLVLALIPAIARVFGLMFEDETEPLTPAQLIPMRACLAFGWLVDYNGETYELYGPQGARQTLERLTQLEDFVTDLENPAWSTLLFQSES